MNSPKDSEPTIKSPFWRLVNFVVYLAIALLFGMIIAILSLLLFRLPESDAIIYSGIFFNIVLLVATIRYVKNEENTNLASIGLTKPVNFKHLSMGFLLAFVLMVLQYGVYLAFDWIQFTPTDAAWFIGFVLALDCALVGLTEEVIFRGYILFLVEKWKGRTIAIIVSSILFWMVHIPNQSDSPFLTFIALIVFSVSQCLFRYIFGNLYFIIAFHAAYDWVLFSVGEIDDIPGYFKHEVTANTLFIGGGGNTGILDIVCPFGFLLVMSTLIYMKKVKSKSDS